MSKRIAFLFAGQGAQAVGMGRDLCQASPAARRVFDQADAILGRPISAVCFDGPLEALTASRNCQPAIYTMSMACLAALTERLPIAPVACGGLSLGEFAAATAAGALSFETGLRLVARRGELMQDACAASRGAMAAVLNADPKVVADACAAAGIDVANYNCPGQIVISGDPDRLKQAVAALQAAGVAKVIPLQVDGAFHSRLMAPAAAAFAPVLDATPFADPACPLAQNFPGDLVRTGAEIRANLKAQITGSVKWEQCMRAVLALGADAVIELGPGKVLCGFMRRLDKSKPALNIGAATDLEPAVQQLGA